MALSPQTPNGAPKPAGRTPDRSDEVFMREVDDALRQDQFSDFMSRYGLWLLLLVVAALVAFGGYIYYRHLETAKSGLRGEELTVALDAARNGNLDGATKAAEPLLSAEQDGYRAAASALDAAILLEQKKPQDAAKAYAKLAADPGAPQPFRDLALVRQTAAEYDDLKPAGVVARLKPLAVPGNPWFGSAGEMVAIAYMRMGKPDLAGPLFLQLAEEDDVPQTIRSRARQLAGTMGVDAVGDPNEAQGVTPGLRTAPQAGAGRP